MPPGREGLLLTMGVLVLVCHMGPAHGNGMWGPIFYETGPGNLPTDTRINVVVVVDDYDRTTYGPITVGFSFFPLVVSPVEVIVIG